MFKKSLTGNLMTVEHFYRWLQAATRDPGQGADAAEHLYVSVIARGYLDPAPWRGPSVLYSVTPG